MVVTVLVGALVSGCSGSDEPSGPRTTAPTPITKLDLGALRIARAEFCDRLPDSAVRRVLGGNPESDDSWGNGDPVPADGASGQVAHELGCSWTAADGGQALAWVFARPVAASFATTLVHQAQAAKGCTTQATSTFGSPALLQTCQRPGGVVRARRAGLFGDTWLTCEVSLAASVPARTRLERLDDWCASVVAVLDANAGG